jgi:Uncharacterized small protein (DUF2158)
MPDNFKVGDVVELKSGGLKMTIERIDDFGVRSPDGGLCVVRRKQAAVVGL